MNVPPRSWKSYLREEFRRKNFLFGYPNAKHFGRFQWFENTTLFVIYRAAMFVYYSTWLVLAGFAEVAAGKDPGLFFVYLTTLAFIVLALYMLYSLIIAIVLLIQDRRGALQPNKPMPMYIKASWVLHVIVADTAIFVTIAYWSLIYHPYNDFPFEIDVHIHAVNTIGIVLDMTLTAMPVRLLHFWLGQCGVAFYALLSVTFWACGGTTYGHHYIYKILDYSDNPGQAALIITLSFFLAVPLAHLVLFGLYKIRQAIHRRVAVQREENYDLNQSSVANVAFVP